MTKMIGVRVPSDSDLPERLRALSDRTGLSYYKLLECWISESEMKPADEFSVDVFDLSSRLSALATRVSDDYSDLDKRILAFVARFSADFSDLDSKVSALSSRLDTLEVVVRPLSPALDAMLNRCLTDDESLLDDIDHLESDIKPDKLDKPDVNLDVKPASKPASKPIVEPDVKQMDESAIVARILELRFKGLTLAVIAERLNAEGVPTLRGGVWHSGKISKLMRKHW